MCRSPEHLRLYPCACFSTCYVIFCESVNRSNNCLHPVSGPTQLSYLCSPFFVAEYPRTIVSSSDRASLKVSLSDLETYPLNYAKHYSYETLVAGGSQTLAAQQPAYSPMYTEHVFLTEAELAVRSLKFKSVAGSLV